MTIKVEAHEEAPSAVLRKDERSERPGFGDRDRGGDRPRRAPRENAVEGEAV
jgi:small subunit ribosomal protein S6